jgi:hypothetical protein
MGQVSRNQPYIGGGLGVFMWRYHESGEFIDFAPTPPMIFDDTETYKASGTSVGPILLGGYRYAFDNLSVGGELRYQWGAGDLDPLVFAGSKIDLGGWTIHGTFGFRF